MGKTTKTGKRTAHFRVQIVEDGGTIEMFFNDHDISPINFNSKTGRSGARGYEKLAKILDLEGAKEAHWEATRSESRPERGARMIDRSSES